LLHIDKLILGTVQFGLKYGISNKLGKPSEKQVYEMLDFAYSKGITKIDTADAYGNASEIIGKYNNITSNKFEINTKFKIDDSKLKAQLENSLEKLNTSFITAYFYHSYTEFIKYPWLKEQLLELKEKGLIKRVGLSVYENEEFISASETDFIDVIQFPFNILDNLSQRGKQIKIAKKNGKILQVRSVYLQGLFFKARTEIPSKLKSLLPHIDEIRRIAYNAGTSIKQLALSYVLQQNEIDNILFGVDTIQQLKENIELSQIVLSENVLNEINQIDVKEFQLLYPKNW
jgi:aryl-alcohol dehydrogenase-like predicted oxidoreductase